MDQLNLDSLRAQRARLSARVGKIGFELLVAFTWLFAAVAVYFFLQNGNNSRLGYLSLSLTLLVFAMAIWDKWDLQKNPSHVAGIGQPVLRLC
jgi:hypothetical protein